MLSEKFLKQNTGFGLIEVIIGVSILSVGILALISSYATYVRYALSNQKNVQATYLLEEGLEVMTFLRDGGWLNISTLGTTTSYYISWNGSTWATTTIPQYVDGQFLRDITVSDVKRDANDAISQTGTYDPNTKKITSTVFFWNGQSTTTQYISTYVTRIHDN